MNNRNHAPEVESFSKVVALTVARDRVGNERSDRADRQQHVEFFRFATKINLGIESLEKAIKIAGEHNDVVEELAQRWGDFFTKKYYPGQDVEQYQAINGGTYSSDVTSVMLAREWAIRNDDNVGVAKNKLPQYVKYLQKKDLPRAPFDSEVEFFIQLMGGFDPLEDETFNSPLQISFGGFTITKLIGEGSMSRVFEAVDQQGLKVALKIPRSSEFHRSIELEKLALSQLDDHRIVKLLHSGIVDSIPFLALELLDGQPLDLAHYVDADSFDEKKISKIIGSAAQGLQIVHDSGMIHGDVKPSNLFLSSNDQVKLVDFGVHYRETDGETCDLVDSKVKGTPLYMAPELLLGDKPTARSDIYSLGIVMHKLLHCAVPYSCESEADLRQTILNDDALHMTLELIGELIKYSMGTCPKLSQLKVICVKCIRKDPMQRYRCAKDLFEDLERVIQDKPINASILIEPFIELCDFRNLLRDFGCDDVSTASDQTSCDEALRNAVRQNWFNIGDWFNDGWKTSNTRKSILWGLDRVLRYEIRRMIEEESKNAFSDAFLKNAGA